MSSRDTTACAGDKAYGFGLAYFKPDKFIEIFEFPLAVALRSALLGSFDKSIRL